MRLRQWAWPLGCLVFLMRCTGQPQLNADDILRLPARPADAKVAYGPAAQQFAELRLPAGRGPFPVVVVIHGGCWIQYASAQYTSHVASALAKEGWATWNLEYRRAHEEGGGWPGTFLDTGRGIDALRDAASKYPLNLERVVLLGHSAGGHLALWAAGRRAEKRNELSGENPLRVRGVVSLAGIADLRAYAANGPKGCAEGALQLMGGDPERQAPRYALASPLELLPLGVSQVLVWGERDTIAPERLFEGYEKRAQQAGDAIEIVRIANAGHHELCSAEQPGWQQIVAAVRRLLR